MKVYNALFPVVEAPVDSPTGGECYITTGGSLFYHDNAHVMVKHYIRDGKFIIQPFDCESFILIHDWLRDMKEWFWLRKTRGTDNLIEISFELGECQFEKIKPHLRKEKSLSKFINADSNWF